MWICKNVFLMDQHRLRRSNVDSKLSCLLKTLLVYLILSGVLFSQDSDWISVGGDRGCARFSRLAQINRENVSQLQIAWTFQTGEADKTIECTPLVIDGTMYITTNHAR